MPSSDGSRRITASAGAQLFYRDWGGGRPVVFVHGWAVNCDIWQYQMMALSPHTRCIAYDKRGHGRSTDPGRGYDYDTLADDLSCVLEDLDLTDVVLVGHSMGPAEIVRYLSRRGDARISRLVLISSALPFMLKMADNPAGIDGAIFENRRQRWSQDMPKFLAENARSLVTHETSAETVAWIADMGLQASTKALFDLNHAITETDLRADVSRVKLPTLIIHGSADKSAPVALTSRVLAATIAQSELRIYDGAPHCLLVTHQSLLNADLDAWVRS
ncbi:MAG TPA: alpha/beta hydrolase [Gemmatimonadaceae bacterium]|jgi:pimeloyl-ACP methyl ester carboxylesterase